MIVAIVTLLFASIGAACGIGMYIQMDSLRDELVELVRAMETMARRLDEIEAEIDTIALRDKLRDI